MSEADRLFALVPCAGSGSRSGAELPKQYVALAGRAVVAHTLHALLQVPRLAAVLVVLSPQDDQFSAAAPSFEGARCWAARCGGATRAATVANGLLELTQRGARPNDWVLVHDAARCLLQPAWVDALIDACLADGGQGVGGLLAVPVADTLKAEGQGRVRHTIDRRRTWAAQTPQMFRLGLLMQALAQADMAVTDESSAIEALGFQPRLVEAPSENFKVTWPADFALAERLLRTRESSQMATPPVSSPASQPLRIGEGWDTHALVEGRPLVLGGITIAHTHGLLGHSDADALLHAITDALLGAAALGDIGRHFPDTDPAFKGADSGKLLAEAMRRVRASGWELGNLDATIVAQAPKMAPHIQAMRECVAQWLGVAVDQVNVKAKTAEKMGPVGEGRSIETRAVCLLVRQA